MSTTVGPLVEDLAQVLVRVEVAEEVPPVVDLAQTLVRVVAMVGVLRAMVVTPRAEMSPTTAAPATTETGLHLLGPVDREAATQEATLPRLGAMDRVVTAQAIVGATLPRLETMGLATPAQTKMAGTLEVAQLSRTESMPVNTVKATGTAGTAVTVVTVHTLTLTSALAIRMRIFGSGTFL
jgi:hypothetical protein